MGCQENQGSMSFTEPDLDGKNNSDLKGPSHTHIKTFFALRILCSMRGKIKNEIGIQTPHDFQPHSSWFLLPSVHQVLSETGPVRVPFSLWKASSLIFALLA